MSQGWQRLSEASRKRPGEPQSRQYAAPSIGCRPGRQLLQEPGSPLQVAQPASAEHGSHRATQEEVCRTKPGSTQEPQVWFR